MESKGERKGDNIRYNKTSKLFTGRCFFRSLYTPMYRSGWQEVLELPIEFAPNVADKVGQEIELRNVLEEKWPVELISYNGILALGRGWKAFVDRHKLEEYNLLVFRSFDSHFKVEVYSKFYKEKLSVARFCVPLDWSNWIHMLVLPNCISATVADKIGQETKLENALGEEWTVRFSSYGRGVAFERGWKEFANYHNIEEGDILVFRCFDNGSLFEVKVFNGKTYCEKACRRSLIRAQQDGREKGKRKISTSFELPNEDLGSPDIEQVKRNSRGKTVADNGAVSSKGKRSRPQETSNVNQPDDPFGPYTCLAATSGRDLVLPELPTLINKGNVGKGRMVKNYILVDEEGRYWPASYTLKTWRLSCSWGVFAAVNGIKAGDRLSFAAYDEVPATYKITVIRST